MRMKMGKDKNKTSGTKKISIDSLSLGGIKNE